MNARSDTTGRPFYGWKLVGALWWLDLLNMGLPLYCSSVINSYMLQRIPMERSTFGLGYTLVNFFVGVPSALIALVILRRGVRATLVLGAGLICLGSLWMALVAAAPWHYLVGFGVIIGSGIGGLSTIADTAVELRRNGQLETRQILVIDRGMGHLR